MCTILHIYLFCNIIFITSNQNAKFLSNILGLQFNNNAIKKSSTPSELASATLSGYTQLSCPRTIQKNLISDKTLSGGPAFLILDSISIILNPSHNDKSFEHPSVTFKLPSSTLVVFNNYRPPISSKYSQPVSAFLDEFQTFLSSAVTTSDEFIITGDFYTHLDDSLDSYSQQFTDLLSSTNLIQNISVSNHIIILHNTSFHFFSY